MKYCQFCGFPAPNDAKYCEKCGKSLNGKSNLPGEDFAIPSIGGGNRKNQQTSYGEDKGTSLPSFLTGKKTYSNQETDGFDFDTINDNQGYVPSVEEPKKDTNKKLRNIIIVFVLIIVSILAFVFIREGVSASKITYKNAEKILYEPINDIDYVLDVLGTEDSALRDGDKYIYTWKSWLKSDKIVVTFRLSELDNEYIVEKVYFNNEEVQYNISN